MDSINGNLALKIAQEKIFELGMACGDEFQIMSERTQEIPQGWVFFFSSADYVRTKNPMFALAGNGPILVLRNGGIVELPTAVPWQESVGQIPYLAPGRAA